MIQKKEMILFGISSGIAAYKMVGVIQQIVSDGYQAECILTDHATQMIDPKKIKESGAVIADPLFPSSFSPEDIVDRRHVPHIDMADRASLCVIAPATANIVAKMAHGIADDLLTTTLLAVQCPILVFPSMNVHMWQHPAVQENIQILQRRGVFVHPPDDGPLACGYEGKGRLPSPDTIVSAIRTYFTQKKKLQGKKIVITAGATQEKIDDVRMMTNRASGKMGASFARVCARMGASVILIRTRRSVSCPQVKEEVVDTADEMESFLHRHIQDADMVVHTAAVGDFSITPVSGKMDSKSPHTLQLLPRKKIINQLKVWNPSVYVVGFKAVIGMTKEEMIVSATEKQKESHADAVFVNDVGKEDRGFGADKNEGWLIRPGHPPLHIPHQEKESVASHIIESLLSSL